MGRIIFSPSFISPFKAFSPLHLSYLFSLTLSMDLSSVSLSMLNCVSSGFLCESHLCQLLVFFSCRVAVMSTASHTVGTQPFTVPAAGVRWTRCGCCWRVELTAVSRTTIMTPLWWWPRTRKWVRGQQRDRKYAVWNRPSWNAILTLLFVFSWLWVAASGQFR